VNIFVAGATGVLGRPTVQALVGAGHHVRGAARGVEKAQLLRSLSAEPATVDLFNPTSVRLALNGCDAVVNLATKIPPLMRMRSAKAWEENDRLRSLASRVLADAAKSAGIRLYIQESITFIYADGGDTWLDEDSPLDVSWVSLQSMINAERVTQEFAWDGRRGINLRFGAFYAPSAQSTVDTARLARRRMFPVAGRGDNFFSSIHVDDAAAAVAASLGLPSGEYNIVDDEPLTAKEYAEAVTKALGAGRAWSIPTWVFRFAAGSGPTSYILRSQRVSNARFKQATGWAPRHPSARAGWRQVAKVLNDGAK
jgi:nucleoside-diphosphate-sugar epimerase